MPQDFVLERALERLDPRLHDRYKDTVFALQETLRRYRCIFPGYTDHSFLHTMNINELSNSLIGENVSMMNAGEIYTYLMASAMHDTGMGVSEKDLSEFSPVLGLDFYKAANPKLSDADVIRDWHHELSGLFIKKYAPLFEIPDEYLFPIIQTARGHRKTDLYDEKAYASDYRAGGYKICLPYLAAMLRLADELDIAANRNMFLDYDISNVENEYSISVWHTHMTVKSVRLTDSQCIITVTGSDDVTRRELASWTEKIQAALDYTADVVKNRTDFYLAHRTVMTVEK